MQEDDYIYEYDWEMTLIGDIFKSEKEKVGGSI